MYFPVSIYPATLIQRMSHQWIWPQGLPMPYFLLIITLSHCPNSLKSTSVKNTTLKVSRLHFQEVRPFLKAINQYLGKYFFVSVLPGYIEIIWRESCFIVTWKIMIKFLKNSKMAGPPENGVRMVVFLTEVDFIMICTLIYVPNKRTGTLIY